MAIVTGALTADFIHWSGDGLVAPGIFNEIAQSTALADVIDGGAGDDLTDGDDGDDQIIGGQGKDQLTGGGKQDVLTGGGDRDLFILSQGKDSGPYAHTRDIITDFNQEEGDRIDLSRMDGDTTVDGDGVFYLAGSAFTNRPGELIQFSDGDGNTILAGDSSGDGFPEFEFLLQGGPVLTSADFIF